MSLITDITFCNLSTTWTYFLTSVAELIGSTSEIYIFFCKVQRKPIIITKIIPTQYQHNVHNQNQNFNRNEPFTITIWLQECYSAVRHHTCCSTVPLVVYKAPLHPWLSKLPADSPLEPSGFVWPASGHALHPQTWKRVDDYSVAGWDVTDESP